jgi:hypothetical protein
MPQHRRQGTQSAAPEPTGGHQNGMKGMKGDLRNQFRSRAGRVMLEAATANRTVEPIRQGRLI